MVEVFKTNVKDRDHASMLLEQIHNYFIDYKANFDLEDCDKILRVKCATGSIRPSLLIDLLKEFGFNAEVLPDDLQTEDCVWLSRKISSKNDEHTTMIQQ